MTNSIKMTRNINASLNEGSPGNGASRLSMISMIAIAAGMAAAPAQAQDMTAPAMIAPVQAPPVLSPQPAPAATPTMDPVIAAPPASSPPVVTAQPTPSITPERADDLARKGGFDAETAAPEALAQIEREQQEHKAAAANAAAAKAAAAKAAAASAPLRTSQAPASSAGNDRTEGANAATAPVAMAIDGNRPVARADNAPAAIPATATAPQGAAPPADAPGDTDWSLLAALAALLGVGGAGAYAASRRRKSKDVVATQENVQDPLPASVNAAIMPELRRDRSEEDIRPAVATARAKLQPQESKATTKADFAAFVANLPAFDKQLGKATSGLPMGERRVAAAPRPYLAESDLYRTAGYFTANVDAMPTPQNPFLTRQKRLKRARYLDGKLVGTKAPAGKAPARMSGEMKVSRPLEPAFS
jgi:hypothetical protein